MERESILELLQAWHKISQQKKIMRSMLLNSEAEGIDKCIADVIMICSEHEIIITEADIVGT